jgi:hypothetical protein
MGIDFIRNKRQPHRKAWNTQLLRRSTDLFTASQTRPSVVFRCQVQEANSLSQGAPLIVRRLGDGSVVITQDTQPITTVVAPSRDLQIALETHDRILAGRVYESFPDLKTFDIELEV